MAGVYGAVMAAISPLAHLSVDERVARGRAARELRPRGSLAAWRVPLHRAEPIDLLAGQETDRVPVLLPVRHFRTAASPFAFYRGSAIVMAADLGSMPTSGLTVQLCGDAHLANFGVFRAPDRRLVFDGDDFDETMAGPFEWDVLRLATSFVLAGLEKSALATSRSAVQARARAGRKAAFAAAATYRMSMRSNASRPAIDVWYARGDEQALRTWSRGEPKSNRLLADLAAGRAGGQSQTVRSAVEHYTTRKGGARRFLDADALVRIGMDDALSGPIVATFQAYRAQLAAHRAELVNHYEVIDIGHKVVGVGSVGLPDFVLLMQGRSKDDLLLLQLKATQRSALLAGLPAPTGEHTTEAQRIVVGARLSQPDTDVFLGPADLPGAPSRYLRQLRDGKWAPDVTTLSNGRLVDFARMCAHALARSHARTGDPVAIAAYLGRGSTFDLAAASFARRYAAQVVADAGDYRAAIGSGRLAAAATVAREELLDGLRAMAF